MHVCGWWDEARVLRENMQTPHRERIWTRNPLAGISSRKCVFGCEGKLTLFSFPQRPSDFGWVVAVCVSWLATPVRKGLGCLLRLEDGRFLNKDQYDAGFAGRLKTLDCSNTKGARAFIWRSEWMVSVSLLNEIFPLNYIFLPTEIPPPSLLQCHGRLCYSSFKPKASQ